MKPWTLSHLVLVLGATLVVSCQSDLALDFSRSPASEGPEPPTPTTTGMMDAEAPAQPSSSCDGGVECEPDNCPTDPLKTEPGICGCGELDVDSDEDDVFDCDDDCPDDPEKSEPGGCGCGESDEDQDSDGALDCEDECPSDAEKVAAGLCGCDMPETDADGDDVPDCIDGCVEADSPSDPTLCGCAATNLDTDDDGAADCADGCPEDPDKTAVGLCGCGQPEGDTDGDGVCDSVDDCPDDPAKTAPGMCGCGERDEDTDDDGTCDFEDECPEDPDKVEPEACGCDVAELDTDGDGTCDAADGCPDDPDKAEPGACGCDVPEGDDTDDDGTRDCVDDCVDDPLKQAEGTCGCGNPDTLGSNDVAECVNLTTNLLHRYQFSGSGSTVTDSEGTVNGTVIGGTLPGDGTAVLSAGVYVNLPNNVIEGLTDVTIEAWFTRTAAGTWTRLFDFGSSDGGEGQQGTGTSSLFYTVEMGEQSRVGFRPLGGAEITQGVGTPAPLNTMAHVVVVADAGGDAITVYQDGTLAGTLAWTGALSNITPVNNWIGHSQYGGDPDFVGRIHEFRIYSEALDEGAVQYSYDGGLDPSFL